MDNFCVRINSVKTDEIVSVDPCVAASDPFVHDADGLSNLAKRRSNMRDELRAGPRCSCIFVEYEVTYRIHYRDGYTVYACEG